MAARLMVTVRRVLEDGSEAAADGELAAALADSAEQFAGLLQATFALDAAREERAPQVTSAAGVRHRTVEAGQGRGLASVFGPCGLPGWPTGTGTRRTCTLLTPGR